MRSGIQTLLPYPTPTVGCPATVTPFNGEHNAGFRCQYEQPSAHAAAIRASDPASRRQGVWLGGRSAGNSSFPRTEVRHLDPAIRIFRAAFTSRSCDSPQFTQFHCLTTRCLRPLGPERAPQLEHARVVFRSLTTSTVISPSGAFRHFSPEAPLAGEIPRFGLGNGGIIRGH
jgi:hypothetical protein